MIRVQGRGGGSAKISSNFETTLEAPQRLQILKEALLRPKNNRRRNNEMTMSPIDYLHLGLLLIAPLAVFIGCGGKKKAP